MGVEAKGDIGEVMLVVMRSERFLGSWLELPILGIYGVDLSRVRVPLRQHSSENADPIAIY